MSEMTCARAQARLTALLDAELTERMSARLRAHLAECADCKRHWNELAAAREMAQAWTVEGGEVWEAVRQEIAPGDFSALMAEMAALRAALQDVRAEVAALRRELAARPAEPARRPSAPLFPVLPPEQSLLRIV
ncbi:MAG TPA: zf-HC2 domain-containing protein [Chthonomonadaceae bacterium]|nr:zf-HC2 domain-containing protein [Chthonomonadaceae bacterium]